MSWGIGVKPVLQVNNSARCVNLSDAGPRGTITILTTAFHRPYSAPISVTLEGLFPRAPIITDALPPRRRSSPSPRILSAADL